MKTIVIQIGNSDDKLTQIRWAAFIQRLREVVGLHCGQVHFDGGSKFDSQWQNYCIVGTIWPAHEELLRRELVSIRKDFNQDSIALMVGNTEFV